MVTAENGPLPSDTVVTVKSGSGVEAYALASPPLQPETVFCHPMGADAGADASADASADTGPADASVPPRPIDALFCLLWTNGAAQVTIRGSGYPDLIQMLDAQRDSCGIKTVDESLVLGAPDAGSP